MIPYVSIDLETTGINHDTCMLLEFGAVIDDWVRPIDKLPRFHCYMDNGPVISGEPYAFSMHPTMLRRIANREEGYQYCKGGKALKNSFLKFLIEHGVIKDEREAFIPAGKNFGSFDRQFLNKLDGWNVKMHHRAIDPTMLFWIPGEVPPNLEECKKRAGLSNTEVLHTAIDDALDVVRCVRYYYTKFNPTYMYFGSPNPMHI